MHRKASFSGIVRASLIVLFASAVVFSFAPAAAAQMGVGGAGGGAGGAGSKGGGGRGSRDQQKQARPKRHEVPPVDPAAAREKLQAALVIALTRGTVNTPYLSNLFEQASTGAIPASAQARKAFADELAAAFKGNKLEQDNATVIAEHIAAFINIDGIEPDELTGRRDSFKEALGTAGMTEEQVVTTLAAADQLVAQQQDETKITQLAEDLTKGLDSAQLTTKERAQLAWDIRAVFSSGAMAPAQFQPLLNQVRGILKAGLVKQADAQAVVNDLQAIHKSLNGTAPAAAPAPAAGAGAAGEVADD